MKIRDVADFMLLADRDLDSAEKLSSFYPANNEVIACLSARSVEKYLKSFLIAHDIIPEKNHNIQILNKLCNEIDSHFSIYIPNCDQLKHYPVDVQYNPRIQVDDEDMKYAINTAKKLKDDEKIICLRNEIMQKYGENWKEIIIGNATVNTEINENTDHIDDDKGE